MKNFILLWKAIKLLPAKGFKLEFIVFHTLYVVHLASVTTFNKDVKSV